MSDPKPSGPLFGRFMGPGEENPSLMTKVDTAAGMLLLHPDKLRSEPYRAQMVGELDKGYSGGILTKIARGLTKVIPGTEDNMSPERMEQFARDRPLDAGEKTLAQGVGMALPGSLSRVAGGIGGRGAMSVPGVASMAGRAPALGMAGVGAASAAAAAGAQAGVQTATAGGGVRDSLSAAKEAATDPLNAGIGAFFGGALGAGANMRAGNRNVRFIEERGGRVSMGSPGQGGALDDDIVRAGIDPDTGRVTEAGKGRSSRMAAEGVSDALEARGRAVGERLRSEVSGAADEMVDVSALYARAREMVENPLLPRGVRGQIQREVVGDVLEPVVAQARALGGPGRAPMMTAAEANDLKKKIQYFADFKPAGAPGSPDPHFARLSNEASQNVGDGIGRANARAHSDYTDLESARGAFGVGGNAKDEISRPQREALATRLGRRGADTRYAGRDNTPDVEAALQRYPELRRYVEAPELLQARGNLEFGLGGDKLGGLYEKLKDIVGRNIEPATVRLLAPLLMGAGRQAPVAGNLFKTVGDGLRAEKKR
jgi:hypothetical protein